MDEEKLQQDLQNFKFQVKIYLIFVVYTKGYQVSSRHGFNHVVKFSSSNDNFYIGIPTSFTDWLFTIACKFYDYVTLTFNTLLQLAQVESLIASGSNDEDMCKLRDDLQQLVQLTEGMSVHITFHIYTCS